MAITFNSESPDHKKFMIRIKKLRNCKHWASNLWNHKCYLLTIKKNPTNNLQENLVFVAILYIFG